MNGEFEWREAPAADFAVIGNPVSHSLSPRMHQSIYDELGLDYRYVAVRVDAGEVGPALDHLLSLGYRGVNVTVPHKQEVLGWCTIVEPFAQRVEAANTIDLPAKSCLNTDAPGFLETLRDLPLSGRRVLALGAGGSARAILAALAEGGWEGKIYNRTPDKAVGLAAQIGFQAVSNADPVDADLILNMTSSAFTAEAPPVDWGAAKREAVAYDLMYSAEPTPFLREASKWVSRTLNGLPLLVAQGALSFEWWTGLAAPRDRMARAIS